MSAIVRFLLISTAVVVPWGIVLLAKLEMKVIALLKPFIDNDLALVSVLLLPPMGLFILKWLFEPRDKRKSRKYSGNKDIIIRFRG